MEDYERAVRIDGWMLMKEDYEDIVKRPGKFEGEESFAPFFYDLWMQGMGNDPSGNDDDSVWFDVTPEDIALFPSLEGTSRVRMTIDESGFVRCCKEEVL